MPIPIVDSHIHLFPATHLPTLAWYDGPSSPLGSQHSVDEYRTATSPISTSPSEGSSKYLRGFVFLETDRISSVSESDAQQNLGWSHALDEVSFLARIARGEPIDGEGHKNIDKELCLGIIPWAPIPGGPDVLERYVTQVKQRAGTDDVMRKIRGFRYLVQDKPAGVMIEPGFVQGLRWLGRQGYTFDLGVDARQGGLHQLREAVEMMEQVYKGLENQRDALTIVISKSIFKYLSIPRLIELTDHLCKPNLRLSPESVLDHADFQEWKDLVTKMARANAGTYMKLSGAFSELPPLSANSDPDISGLITRLQPWTDVIFDAFGADRVMFGSDWPVCNIGGGGNTVSWNRWKDIVEGLLDRRGLTEAQKQGVWGQVAIEAYGIVI